MNKNKQRTCAGLSKRLRAGRRRGSLKAKCRIDVVRLEWDRRFAKTGSGKTRHEIELAAWQKKHGTKRERRERAKAAA